MFVRHVVAFLFVALALGISSSQLSAAPITVDDLSRAGSVADAPLGGPTVVAQGPGAGHIGSRTLFADQNPTAGATTLTILAGSLATGNTAGGGLAGVNYSAFGTLDLTGFSSLDFNVTTFDAINGAIDLTVLLTDNNGTFSQTQAITGLGAFSFNLGAFLAGQRDQVTQITLQFNFDSTEDLVIQGGGGITIQEVPEPASLALWGVVGVAGVWYARRRLVKKAAAA